MSISFLWFSIDTGSNWRCRVCLVKSNNVMHIFLILKSVSEMVDSRENNAALGYMPSLGKTFRNFLIHGLFLTRILCNTESILSMTVSSSIYIYYYWLSLSPIHISYTWRPQHHCYIRSSSWLTRRRRDYLTCNLKNSCGVRARLVHVRDHV